MDEYDYIGFFEGEKYVCSCREQKLKSFSVSVWDRSAD